MVLIVVFDYILACALMLFYQETDPFHFGNLGRSMFTVIRISTLDSWDQILNIGIFDCER